MKKLFNMNVRKLCSHPKFNLQFFQHYSYFLLGKVLCIFVCACVRVDVCVCLLEETKNMMLSTLSIPLALKMTGCLHFSWTQYSDQLATPTERGTNKILFASSYIFNNTISSLYCSK